MWSKIMAWDEKWIYIVTHFVRKGAVRPKSYSLYPQQGPAGLKAEDLAKLDEKHESKTRPPFDEEAMRRASFDSINSTSSSGSESEFIFDGPRPSKQIFATALSKCVFKSGRKTVAPELMLQMSGLLPVIKPVEDGDMNAQVTIENMKTKAILEGVEMERQRGLKIAHNLAAENQYRLESEFPGEEREALGRHSDGAGIIGVVNILLQLAHMKQGQVL
jgi:hypothetical protein